MIRSILDEATGLTARIRDGGGPPIVFLHGIGSNADSFDQVMASMPEGRCLIAWNAPGYGESRPLDIAWPVAEDYAAVLSEFLARVAPGPVIVLGHSLGTLIAAALARNSASQVVQLVLAASACGYGVPPGGALPSGVAARITDIEVLGPAAFAQSRAPRLVWQPQDNPDLVRRIAAAMASVRPRGYGQAARMLASGDLPATLAEIAVPAGFIIGAHDAVTPPSQTERAARAAGAALGYLPPVLTIPGAGHAVYQQQPAAFVRALLGLIEGSGTHPSNPVRAGGQHV